MSKIVLVLAVLVLSGCERLEGYDAGRFALKLGDYPKALREFQALSEAGDARAQVILGTLYATGSGVPKDESKASSYYSLSAHSGNARAQYLLAVAYEHGSGLARNPDQALVWMKRSAENGYPIAMIQLARQYEADRGNPEGLNLAIMWLTRAHEYGDNSAAVMLDGLYLSRFIGQPMGVVEDYAWVKASSQINGDAARKRLASAEVALAKLPKELQVQAKIKAVAYYSSFATREVEDNMQ